MARVFNLIRQGRHNVKVQFRTEELKRNTNLAEFTLIRRLGLEYANEVRKLHKNAGAPPSSPGNPPARRTRRLFRSIRFFLTEGRNGWSVTIGSVLPVDYAKFLEFGTRFMQPRPMWRPAFKNVKPRVKALIKKSRTRSKIRSTFIGR